MNTVTNMGHKNQRKETENLKNPTIRSKIFGLDFLRSQRKGAEAQGRKGGLFYLQSSLIASLFLGVLAALRLGVNFFLNTLP
jgi:hypothetical protein